MVRAILAGRKTQTRRVVKPQPWDESKHIPGGCGFAWSKRGEGSSSFDWNTTERALAEQITRYCPYGQPGDRLWVKETFHCNATFDGPQITYSAYQPGESRCERRVFQSAPDSHWWLEDDNHWRPSIHMPRWASRITVEIVAVRVERLKDISNYDALAEGVELRGCTQYGTGCRDAFRALWESRRGPGSWNANPWVWVIEFRRIQ